MLLSGERIKKKKFFNRKWLKIEAKSKKKLFIFISLNILFFLNCGIAIAVQHSLEIIFNWNFTLKIMGKSSEHFCFISGHTKMISFSYIFFWGKALICILITFKYAKIFIWPSLRTAHKAQTRSQLMPN